MFLEPLNNGYCNKRKQHEYRIGNPKYHKAVFHQYGGIDVWYQANSSKDEIHHLLADFFTFVKIETQHKQDGY